MLGLGLRLLGFGFGVVLLCTHQHPKPNPVPILRAGAVADRPAAKAPAINDLARSGTGSMWGVGFRVLGVYLNPISPPPEGLIASLRVFGAFLKGVLGGSGRALGRGV